MAVTPPKPAPGQANVDRRVVVGGLAALVAYPQAALAALDTSWTLATQILTGTRILDPTVLHLIVEALESEFGAPVVDRLREAVSARDAANIVEPFAESDVEAAARRFVEIAYTGELHAGTTLAFHQALAWQILPFTKPPSVCGPGFGRWTNSPASQ